MRVFLDANVLFSGAQPHSRMRALLQILFKRAVCLTHSDALEEVRRNLGVKCPEILPHFEMLAKKCELTSSFPAELPVPLKEKDQPILAGAMAGRATHLMTGDQTDFGHLFGKTVEGVKVVSPKMLAEKLVELGWL